MNNFIFYNPTKILFGRGQIIALPHVIPENSKVLIVYGGGSVKKNGVFEQAVQSLPSLEWFEFSGVEPNPEYSTLMKAVEQIKSKGIDFVLAVGGGSVIDGTKFICAAAKFEGDPWDILAKRSKVKEALPFGSVLTLAATGSEMNCAAVISRKEFNKKLGFISSQVYPQFSILDPEFTFTVPKKQIANGVVDAFVHVCEQYLTKKVNAPLNYGFSETILRTLIENGPLALEEPQNFEVRENLMWSATMALNNLIGSGVPQDWSTHMIGHELTNLFGLDHAQSLAVVLPGVLKFNIEPKREMLIQFAEKVWGEDSAEKAIEKTEDFFKSLGVSTRLKDYSVGSEKIDQVIASLEKSGMTALGEDRNISPQVAKQILQSRI